MLRSNRRTISSCEGRLPLGVHRSFQPADFFLAAAGIALLLALAGILWLLLRVRRIGIPPNTDWKTALRKTPLSVVIVLDLLDFSLDIFSAPISWGLLGYLGLRPLRGFTTVESLIPGTQLLPTMTAAWLVARYL